MKVNIIIENKSYREGLIGQYGLSMLIESNNHSLLLDAGSDESAFLNYISMGYSPNTIDAIVVSHNHFDHIGGIPYFLNHCNSKVYISEAANGKYYTKSFFHRRHLVSRTDIIENAIERFEFVKDQIKLFENIYICRIDEPDPFYLCKDKRLKRETNGKLELDNFEHEVYVAVIENNECKILSSCSHNGIINIINDTKKRFNNIPITTFIGGMHMRGRKSNTLNCSLEHVKNLIDAVEKSGIKTIFTGHCTGFKAYDLLRKTENVRIEYFSTGDCFEA